MNRKQIKFWKEAYIAALKAGNSANMAEIYARQAVLHLKAL